MHRIVHPQGYLEHSRISTMEAFAKIVDQIYESFENNSHTVGIFIDLSKAFDTIDHTIFLKKLEIYGITEVTFAWFKSYLTKRK